jgi:hypothetical protein
MYYLQLKPKASWYPQGHHNVHIGFVTIDHTVQKFKRYRKTYQQHGDVKVWVLEGFPF